MGQAFNPLVILFTLYAMAVVVTVKSKTLGKTY